MTRKFALLCTAATALMIAPTAALAGSRASDSLPGWTKKSRHGDEARLSDRHPPRGLKNAWRHASERGHRGLWRAWSKYRSHGCN